MHVDKNDKHYIKNWHDGNSHNKFAYCQHCEYN